MAIGNTKESNTQTHDLKKMVPISLTSNWVTCIDAGGMDDVDAAPNNPYTIDEADHHPLLTKAKGTKVMARLKYDATLTAITDPVIQLHGKDDAGNYHALRDSDGAKSLTLATDAGDETDSTWNWTEPVEVDVDADVHVLPTVETALAGSTGLVTTATLELKIK